MATNRADTLDPALLRPGRLDRKIEFPLPDRRQRRLILQTITAKMNLSEEVDLEDCMANRLQFVAAIDAVGGKEDDGKRGLEEVSCCGILLRIACLQLFRALRKCLLQTSRPSARRLACRPSARTGTTKSARWVPVRVKLLQKIV